MMKPSKRGNKEAKKAKKVPVDTALTMSPPGVRAAVKAAPDVAPKPPRR